MGRPVTEVPPDRALDREFTSGLQLRVLGPFEAAVGNDVLDLGGPKQRGVLALLALRAPSGLSVDALIDGLWGDFAPEAARSSVYSYVSNLRALLGGGIERQRNAYVLAAPFASDAGAFETAADQARGILAVDPLDAAVVLWDALATWRGLPYADLMGIPGLQEEIRRLEELRLLAVEMRLEAELASGRGDELVPELRALVAENPLRERLRAQLMLALYRSGRQAEALREYGQVRELLVTELGVDPSPELQDLEVRILRQDEMLSAGTGQVTTQRLAFLFTDIEGSTRLWNEHRGVMAEALARHDEILRVAVEEAGGVVFKHTGDGSISAFPRTDAAAAAAEQAQRALHEADWGRVGDLRVRMAIDVGDVDVRDGDYFGPPLNRCARILGSAHGGQVILSSSAFDDLSSGHHPGVQIKQLGTHRLRGLGAAERLAQLVFVGLPAEFPELVTDAGATDVGERLEVGGLPGYELRERLGAGTWGSVFRAYQPAVGREVAIRVISPHLANHPSFVRRFEAHARAVAQLEHPHIVPLYDFWRDHDGAYLVMQLMRGGSLERAMREEPWDPVAAVGLLRQVGSALAYAHSEGAIHGDIRPANILLDGRGNAYVSDFGLGAGFIDSLGLRLHQTSSTAYQSPEARADGVLDPRSDVYSVAVLTYALLTGCLPPTAGLLPHPPLAAQGLEALHAVLLRGSAHDREERFEDVPGLVADVEEALGIGDVPKRPPVRTGLRNPFKGLRAFSEGDAGDFYGRSELVETLVEAVGLRRLVAVVGPSGSGKSSAVQAGLLPRLRAGAIPGSEEWFFGSLTPGPHPVGALGDALRPLAMKPLGDIEGRLLASEGSLGEVAADLLPPGPADLVLVVDQFEELFTLTLDDDEREQFIDLLIGATAARSRVRVVVTLRADFYDRPLEQPALATLVAEGLLTLVPPTVDELMEAIEGPALGVGLAFEPGLPMRIARDVVGQPGGLPLLQYALTEMVERRGADLLTGVDYEAIGTVRGAVARRAESVFSSLDEGEQEAARDMLLRLVTVDEETDDTRRRVRLTELEGLGHHPRAVNRVLDAFGASRLLSFDHDPVTRAPTVEVAHEALLREWGRLRRWIEGEREALILARRLRLAMSEWQESGCNDDFLLTGDRLSPFREWSRSRSVTREERDFLARSSAADETARAARRRRRRLAVTSLSTAAIVATILAVLALTQRARADREATRAVALADQQIAARQEADAQAALADKAATEAKQAEALAKARELAASAVGVGETDPQLAMLLALEALDTQPQGVDTPVELRNALRRAIHDNHLIQVIPVSTASPGDVFSPILAMVIAADGSTVAVTGSDTRRVYSSDTWQTLWETDDPGVSILALSPGGDRMLLQRSDTTEADPASPATIEIVSLPDGAVESTLTTVCAPLGALASWARDGSLVALIEPDCTDSSAATIRVYDAASGLVVHELPANGENSVRIEFVEGADGPLLVYTEYYTNPGALVFDGTTFEQVASFPYSSGAVSPDGSLFLGFWYGDTAATLIDVATGATVDKLDGLQSGTSLTQAGYFSPDGRRLAIANEGSDIPVWDVESGRLELTIPAGHVGDMAFVDADTLVTAGSDGYLRVWDLSLERSGELESVGVAGEFQMHGIQASDALGTAWVWDNGDDLAPAWIFDPATGALVQRLPDSASWPFPAVAGDAGVLYIAGSPYQPPVEGPLRWWSAETGDVVDVDCCWTDVSPEGSIPKTQLGTISSVDGSEAAFLTADGRFRVWRDGPTPVEDVHLALGEVTPMSLLMGFSDEWIVVLTNWASYEVFDRHSGNLETSFKLPDHPWLHFDRTGSVGIGSGFSRTLSVVSTQDWTWRLLTADLGEGYGRGVALSPTGDRVAVGVMDGFVRVFEVGTGTLLDVMPLHGAVTLYWLDDTHIAAGTTDGLWTVLTLDIDELEGLARNEVTRDFTPDECALYRIESCDPGT